VRRLDFVALVARGPLVLAALAALVSPARASEPGCPPTFKQASGPCDPRTGPASKACVYPEGRCTCARTVPCSGVPQPPGEPRWKCTPARTDGCPEDQPPQGRACAKPGLRCAYGDCGSIELTCDASARVWLVTGGHAPPPSLPGPPPRPPAPPPPKPTPAPSDAATRKEPPAWKHCPPHAFVCARDGLP
jgi:hypothetical protein